MNRARDPRRVATVRGRDGDRRLRLIEGGPMGTADDAQDAMQNAGDDMSDMKDDMENKMDDAGDKMSDKKDDMADKMDEMRATSPDLRLRTRRGPLIQLPLACAVVSKHGTAHPRPHRPTRLDRRPRHLAARRRLGRGHRVGRAGRARRLAGCGGHLLRHRGRLRRRPQRVDHRRLASRPPGRAVSSSRPRWAAGSSSVRSSTTPRTSEPGPTAPVATSASTPSTWCSCTARRPPSTSRTRCSTPSTPSSTTARSRRTA